MTDVRVLLREKNVKMENVFKTR